MKSKLLLFLATVLSFPSFAQVWIQDSVAMGAGYASDVYYSFKNDSIKAATANDWHLSFEMIPIAGGGSGSVGVFANHVAGNVTVYSLQVPASSFATLAPADTVSKNGPLLNPDSTWHYGAFNTNLGASPFDYGWGKYNMGTHHVEGDSIYLVYVGATPYKLWIKHYHSNPLDSIYYEFRIAKFDGTDDVTKRVYRKYDGFENRNFAYYNIETGNFINREPDWKAWDVVFTRYKEWVVAGPPPTPKAPYSVTGLLSNIGVEVSEIDGVNPDTCTLDTNSSKYSDRIQEIGSDWKAINMTTFQYDIDTDRTYFVKTWNTMEYYQIKFSAFVGSSAGKSVFSKRKVGDFTVGIKNIENNEVLGHALVPNPANTHADLMLDIKEAGNAQLLITDMNGRVMQHAAINIRKGLNGYRINTSGLATGTYMVTVTNGTWKSTDKLVVQH